MVIGRIKNVDLIHPRFKRGQESDSYFSSIEKLKKMAMKAAEVRI